jgi:uncharacterized protein YijF (DUF1287 family)
MLPLQAETTDRIVAAARAQVGVIVSCDPAYPEQWGLARPDRNIDHRRVPNLRAYFKRRGFELPTPAKGDIVTRTVSPDLPHVMIMSDRRTSGGAPLAIHDMGGGAREEDSLAAFLITGHYRWK